MWRRGAVVLVASRFARRLATRGAGRAPVAASLRNKLGDQAITVAAIDGADELDDPPCLGDSRPLEKECRRVQWDSEHLGFLIACHGRLGGTRGAVGEPGPGKRGRELERPAARRHAAAPHVVAERRERERLGDLRLGHVGAAAVAAVEVAVAYQLVECGAESKPRDAEVDGELALSRDGLAHRDRLDQVEDAVAGLLLLA